MTRDLLLPGRRHALSIGFPEELWLRDDHLLCVSHTVIFESYQRFYYRDIESLVVVPTRRLWTLNLVSGTFLAMGVLLLLLDAPLPVCAGFAAVWLLLTLVNLAFGPTCKTVLRTRINTRTLTSLRRLRTTRKALALLNERIRAAQAAEPAGEPAEDAPSAPPLPDGPPAAAQASPPPRLDPATPPPLPTAAPASPFWHQALAVLAALQALAALNAALYPYALIAGLLALLVLLASLACVPALITQRRHAALVPLRAACWGFTTFQFIAAYALLMAAGMLLGLRSQAGLDVAALSNGYNTLLLTYPALRGAFVFYAGLALAFVVWLAATLRSLQRP